LAEQLMLSARIAHYIAEIRRLTAQREFTLGVIAMQALFKGKRVEQQIRVRLRFWWRAV